MYINIINRRHSGLNSNQRIKILKAKILLKAMPLTLVTSPQAAKNTQDRPVRLASSLPGARLPLPCLQAPVEGKSEAQIQVQVGRYNSQCGRGVSISISVSHSASLGSSIFIFMMFPPQEMTMKVK